MYESRPPFLVRLITASSEIALEAGLERLVAHVREAAARGRRDAEQAAQHGAGALARNGSDEACGEDEAEGRRGLVRAVARLDSSAASTKSGLLASMSGPLTF